MPHHPYLIAATAWVALIAVTLKIDQGTFVIALSPLVAVILAHQLQRRTQRQIDVKLEAQNDNARRTADAARLAVEQAEDAALKIQKTADETHLMVNSQREALETANKEQQDRLIAQDKRIEILEHQLSQTDGA